jgi:hypothetical protein
LAADGSEMHLSGSRRPVLLSRARPRGESQLATTERQVVNHMRLPTQAERVAVARAMHWLARESYRDNHRCRCHRCRLRRGRRVSSLDVRTHAYRYSITGIATAPAMTPGVS